VAACSERYRGLVQSNFVRAMGNTFQVNAEKLRQVAVNLVESWDTVGEDLMDSINSALSPDSLTTEDIAGNMAGPDA
jgi:hypothetical protein